MNFKQNLLIEDPQEVIVSLNEDLKKTYAELVHLEAERESRRDEANAYEAELEDVYEFDFDRTKAEKDKLRDLKRLAAASTRAVNKTKDKIIQQVGQSIQTAEKGNVQVPIKTNSEFNRNRF